ncbi:hypothetical protein ONE63_008613 [Megalurothrips usitatus]|uniref:Uncharacterized protein n=1 Tax=Megalurothrips usitatus TaxID=439358 RepID=A0AAV7XQA1_9NEOP|nr:hypothetical protein ONE63_008613 [Megalurothrips usitatus]
MESDLLRREQEFHKMNSELEQRTNRILQELDAAKSKVGLSHDISPHLANSSTFGCPKSFCLKNDSQQVNSKEEKEKNS